MEKILEKMKEQQSLAKAIKNLMLQEPFYGIYSMSLNKVWDSKVGTAGVSKRGIGFQLTISPEFWNTLTENQMKGILKHELLHIAFNHIIMRDAKYPDFQLFNIAADMEINQYIDADWLPEGCIDIEKYRDAGLMLEYKAGTDYYYKMLKKDEEQNGPGSELTQQLRGDQEGCGGDGHETWKDFDELSETEKKMLKKQTEYTLSNTAKIARQKSRGTIPGELAELIHRLENPEPPKFDWRGYLRRFAGGGTKIYTKKLRRKLNKRYSDMPGLKIKPKRHVLVGIDTSGSVSSKELEEFFGEIDHIHRTGSDITIIQCDTKIGSIKPYKKGAHLEIVGRGGTSFTPVVDYYNEHIGEFSCLIYLTDGEAPPPKNPPRKRTLWVMSSESTLNDELPGHCIKLN
jgi:predicted metal-dependent peptidase